MSLEKEVLISKSENYEPYQEPECNQSIALKSKVLKILTRTCLVATSIYAGINAVPSEHENFLAINAAHAELSPMA